jgi:hypothetical protein
MSYLKLDKEDDNLFVMEMDYDENENWRDLLCIMMDANSRELNFYELHRCTLPKELGMLNIIGFDMI